MGDQLSEVQQILSYFSCETFFLQFRRRPDGIKLDVFLRAAVRMLTFSCDKILFS